ncbi:MAG: GNAT family N-acetyltransferase [Magnetococcales bacterium]|nr:GNAT family N-acetyltransferase [Magnetococcales bacterium]
MKFVCYTDWNQLPKSAKVLFEKGEKESVFFSRPWFENLVANSLEDNQLMRLACVIEGESVLAILPLMQQSSKNWYALRSHYTTLFTLLITDNAQKKTLDCLAQGLRQLPIQGLQLYPFDEHDKTILLLQRAMESAGFECYRRFHSYSWFKRLEGVSFKTYMAARPGQVRNTITRKFRKLEREHSAHIRLYTNEDLQHAVADYLLIHQASWKAFEPNLEEFVEGLVNHLSKQGWLRLAILYIDEQPAAAQIWFVVHKKASIFRLAYDETWKCYSPGSILTRYLMEHVIDVDKVEEIDYLYGNDAYKKEWMSDRRERWTLGCVFRHEPKGIFYQFSASLKNFFTAV